MTDPFERIIRRTIEGQIRGFLKEHQSIVTAVDWYKPRTDKATTFVNSLSKRIVLDLTCPLTRKRIEAALFEIWENEESGVAPSSAPDDGDAGTATGTPSISTVERDHCGEGDQIGILSDLVAIALRAQIMDGTFQPGHMEIVRAA